MRRPARREKVYRLIDGERDYQDSLKKGPNGRTDGKKKHCADFLVLITDLAARANKAYYDNPGDDAAMEQVRKIAGVAVQAMEVIPTKPRQYQKKAP